MDVPTLPSSWFGSTRASTEVLSQTDPAPGAVTAAHALPPDCGRLPPLAAFSASNSDIVVGSRVTVISAPMRASQYGVTDCLTETAEEPFVPFLFDQLMPPSDVCELRILAAGPSPRVDASTLSWLQSSLLTSMPFSTSSSSALCAGACSAVVVSASSSAGTDWASAGEASAVRKPAASSSALALFIFVETIAPPAQSAAMTGHLSRQGCGDFGAKLWRRASRRHYDGDGQALIFGRWIERPSTCSTRSNVSRTARMLRSRPYLNWAKCAIRTTMGLLDSIDVRE